MGAEQSAGSGATASAAAATKGKDEFFRRVKLRDSIAPIFNELDGVPGGPAPPGGDADGGGNVDLAALLKDLDVKLDGSGELSRGNSIPDAESDDSSSDPFESEEEFTGEAEKPKVDVFMPEAHPVSVRGECEVGAVLTAVDDSPWAAQFPPARYAWRLGTARGQSHVFHLTTVGTQPLLKVRSAFAGYFIQLEVVRNVEHQLQGNKLEFSGRGGVFDAHLGGTVGTHHLTGAEIVRQEVASHSVTGPALIPPEAAGRVASSALASSRPWRCAVKIRDARHMGAAAAAARRVAAEVRIDWPGRALAVKTAPAADAAAGAAGERGFWTELWEKYVVPAAAAAGVGGAPATAAEGRGAAGGMSGPTASAAAAFPLLDIVACPSPASSKAVLVFECSDRARKPLPAVEFDVNPQVGRDVFLWAVFACQGAARQDQSVKNWKAAADRGLAASRCQELVQEELEAQANLVPHIPAASAEVAAGAAGRLQPLDR